MPLFRALAKNMAPMTNADESPTNRLTLFPIYLSLFIVSTLWSQWSVSMFTLACEQVLHVRGQPIKTLNDKFSLVRKHRSSNQRP